MDWQLLISGIEDSGLTQVEIAEKCGCSQPTISDIKNGKIKTPGFPVGQAIVELHATLKPARKKAAA